jgi:hypothetical protein
LQALERRPACGVALTGTGGAVVMKWACRYPISCGRAARTRPRFGTPWRTKCATPTSPSSKALGGGGAGRRGLRTVYPPASADAENSLLDRSVAALEKAAQRLA